VSNTDEAVSIGLTAADVAWPIVLALCIAIMVLPFVFLVFSMVRPDPEEVADDPAG
jgi:hypothetical protein